MKPKTITLAIAASPISTKHKRIKAKTCSLGFSEMCPGGPINMSIGELLLQSASPIKSNSRLLVGTKQIPSKFQQNVN